MPSGEITQDTFTLEDLDAAGKRLHINTVLVLIINGFCSCIIIFNSTKAMAHYKKFLLLTIISSTIMDTHFSFIWGPIPTPPFPGVCSAGFVGSKLGYFWGELFQHASFCLKERTLSALFHYTFSFVGFSLLIAVMYRYLVLKGQEEFLSSWKGIILISATIIIYPSIPTATLALANVNKNYMLKIIAVEAKYLIDIYEKAACAGADLNLWFKIYLISTGFHVIGVYGTAVYFGLKVHSLLNAKKSMLSNATYKLSRQMLISLGVQLTIPLIFLVYPIINLFVVVLLKIPNAKNLCIYTFQTISFHSITNSFSIIFVIKPYRRAFIKFVSILLPKRFRKNEISLLPSHSITGTSAVTPSGQR